MHHFTVSFYSKPHTKDARVFRCNLPPHFWQNDRDLLRATAVTRGWNGHFNNNNNHHHNNNFSIAEISVVQKLTALYNKSQQRKVDPGEEKNTLFAAPAGTRTRDLSITSPSLYH